MPIKILGAGKNPISIYTSTRDLFLEFWGQVAYSARGWARVVSSANQSLLLYLRVLNQPQSLSGQRSGVGSVKKGAQEYESIPLLASAETRCTQNVLLMRDLILKEAGPWLMVKLKTLVLAQT